jgi:peptidoglycan hydrolase-like protein with peptidoglycan-binding domain
MWLTPWAIGQERECKDERIQASGAASVFGKRRALQLAITNWQREVRNKYGERFMVWDRARERGDECESASVGAIGRFNQRCTVAAIPCASTALEDDRGRGRDRDRFSERDRDRDRYRDRRDEREERGERRRYYEDDDRYAGSYGDSEGDFDAFEVQRLLIRWGYPVRLDGIWGGESRLALMRFQKRHALEDDGEPGPKTLSYLRRRAYGGRDRHRDRDDDRYPEIDK